MAGAEVPGSPPPEVPDEFAAAYRAAYEEAMAAQSVPLRHGEHVDAGDDENGLPRRTRPLRIGTHRVSRPVEREEPRPYRRSRDSGRVALIVLAVLALLLVVGAYVLGRAFASHVAGGGSSMRLVMTSPGSA